MESRHRAAAVGHRVVHGGLDFTGPVKVDEEVVGKLEKMIPLAPLHQPEPGPPSWPVFITLA